MRTFVVLFVFLAGGAFAQIKPGGAAYVAVYGIANNGYLNAVNVSCDNYAASADAMCFETDVSDAAFARELVDQSMSSYVPAGFWTRDAAGTQTKTWVLHDDAGYLKVNILAGTRAVLVITHEPPIPLSSIPQDPKLQAVADAAFAEIQTKVDVSQYKCSSLWPNAVCFDTTLDMAPAQKAFDAVFGPLDWKQTKYGPFAQLKYKGQLLAISLETGGSLTSEVIVEAFDSSKWH